MSIPHSLVALQRPVITTLVGSAAAVTVLGLGHAELQEGLLMSPEAFRTAPWRLLTWTLPHEGLVQLFIAMFWTWTLGSELEGRLGHLRVLALVALLASATGSAEYLFGGHGTGLSGIAFGLFGFVLAAKDRAPSPAMVASFVVWGSMSAVLTARGQVEAPIFAQALGLTFGLALGAARAAAGARRLVLSQAVVVAFVAVVVGSVYSESGALLASLNLSF